VCDATLPAPARYEYTAGQPLHPAAPLAIRVAMWTNHAPAAATSFHSMR
jgi:hypothetical protein